MQTIYLWLYLDVGPAIGKLIFSYSLSFPPASLSLHALFQTLRRHRYRLLRQRLNFSTPRDVVTFDLVGSGRRWFARIGSANTPDAGMVTSPWCRLVEPEHCARGLCRWSFCSTWVPLVKERSSWPGNFWPAHRRVDCESLDWGCYFCFWFAWSVAEYVLLISVDDVGRSSVGCSKCSMFVVSVARNIVVQCAVRHIAHSSV